jgi:hypothetical protein
MGKMPDKILVKENFLRELVDDLEDGNYWDVTVRGVGQGFQVELTISGKSRVLATSRGEVRLFASLTTAAVFVDNLGFDSFTVTMGSYKPGRLRSARPDRAAALKFSHGQAKAGK